MKQQSQHIILVVNKEDFKQGIYNRLQTGLAFLSEKILNEQQKDDWWERFIDWEFITRN